MAILYHVTPAKNLKSIKARGINLAFSRTKKPGLWLVSRSNVQWALYHTRDRHHTTLNQLCVIEVHIPRRWSMSGKNKCMWSALKRGIWVCRKTISPEYFGQIWMIETPGSLSNQERKS